MGNHEACATLIIPTGYERLVVHGAVEADRYSLGTRLIIIISLALASWVLVGLIGLALV